MRTLFPYTTLFRSNKGGEIKFTSTIFVRIKGIIHKILFHVMSCGRETLILGMPWLREFNPSVDWKLRTINIPNNSDQTAFLDQELREAIGPSRVKPTFPDLLPSDLTETDSEDPFYPDENFTHYVFGELISSSTNRFY